MPGRSDPHRKDTRHECVVCEGSESMEEMVDAYKSAMEKSLDFPDILCDRCLQFVIGRTCWMWHKRQQKLAKKGRGMNEKEKIAERDKAWNVYEKARKRVRRFCRAAEVQVRAAYQKCREEIEEA